MRKEASRIREWACWLDTWSNQRRKTPILQAWAPVRVPGPRPRTIFRETRGKLMVCATRYWHRNGALSVARKHNASMIATSHCKTSFEISFSQHFMSIVLSIRSLRWTLTCKVPVDLTLGLSGWNFPPARSLQFGRRLAKIGDPVTQIRHGRL